MKYLLSAIALTIGIIVIIYVSIAWGVVQKQWTPFYVWKQKVTQSVKTLNEADSLFQQSGNAEDSLLYAFAWVSLMDKIDVSKGIDRIVICIRLARQLKNNEALALSYLSAGIRFLQSNQPEVSSIYLDSAKSIIKTTDDPIAEFYYYNFLDFKYLVNNDRINRLRNQLKERQVLKKRAPWATELVKNLELEIAQTLFQLNMHDLAFQSLKNVGFDHTDLIKDEKYLILQCNALIEKGNYDSAKSVLAMAPKDWDIAIQRADYFLATNKPNEAVTTLQQSIKQYDKNFSFLNNRLYKLSDAFLLINESDSAEKYIKAGIRDSFEKSESHQVCNGYTALAGIYLRRGQYKTASTYLDSSIAIGTKNNMNNILTNAFQLREDILIKSGNYAELPSNLKQLKHYRERSDSINSESELKAHFMEYLYTSLNEDSIQIFQQSKRLKYSLVLTIFLLVVIVVFFWMFLHERTKRMRYIEKTNSQLVNNNEVLEQKVKERTAEIAEKNNQLIRKNQQLEAYAFMNAHKLRSPVATILGLIDLYGIKSMTEEEKAVYIKMIHDQTQKLDQVVREIQRVVE